MNHSKLLLNNLLDIGGVATLNNFYSPHAKTFKGCLLYTRKLFKSYLQEGLIEKIEPIGKPANKAREVFYCLTKKGTDYIGRTEEYKYRKYTRSPANIMHESMKFDVALAFLRLYPHCKFTFRYDSSFYGVRPDIFVKIEHPSLKGQGKYFLVEIERKKTVDRVFHEKIKRYEEMFTEIARKKSHNLSHYSALFIYTDIWCDVFLRPQEYKDPKIVPHLSFINELVRNLVNHYCKNLNENLYRFTAFHNFHCLNEPVWYTSQGNRISI